MGVEGVEGASFVFERLEIEGVGTADRRRYGSDSCEGLQNWSGDALRMRGRVGLSRMARVNNAAVRSCCARCTAAFSVAAAFIFCSCSA